jgi:high-affinity iron transporter
MKQVGEDVRAGKKPLIVLASVVALAVLREGSEIVLFLQGMMSASPAVTVLGGFAIGLGAGITAGTILYFGLLKLPVGRMFKITNILLALIAAGMAAKGAGKLIQAGYLPPLMEPVWNTSAVLPEDGLPGQFLNALTGYMAEPSGMQLIFYSITVITIVLLGTWQNRKTAIIKA